MGRRFHVYQGAPGLQLVPPHRAREDHTQRRRPQHLEYLRVRRQTRRHAERGHVAQQQALGAQGFIGAKLVLTITHAHFHGQFQAFSTRV